MYSAIMNGKGSKRRPKVISDEAFANAWDNIFVRKVTPDHGKTKVHKSKKSYSRKNLKID